MENARVSRGGDIILARKPVPAVHAAHGIPIYHWERAIRTSPSISVYYNRHYIDTCAFAKENRACVCKHLYNAVVFFSLSLSNDIMVYHIYVILMADNV